MRGRPLLIFMAVFSGEPLGLSHQTQDFNGIIGSFLTAGQILTNYDLSNQIAKVTVGPG